MLMFGFGTKKKHKKSAKRVKSKKDKAKKIQQTIEKELKKQKEREKKASPNWVALGTLIFCMVAGVFFWIYGQVSRFGWQAMIDQIEFQPPSVSLPDLPQESEKTIIFEKDSS